jgi:hypothetical protein
VNSGRYKPLLSAAKGLGLALVFVVSLAGSLLLHSDLAPARRLVASELETLLNDTFQGRFEIDSIERFSRRTLRVSEVRVRDPKGVVVLRVKGLRVRVEAFDVLVMTLLSGDAKATVAFQHVRAERADVVIVPDLVSGVPTLGTAFALSPRLKAKPSSPKPSTLRVWFPTIELGEGSVRGRLEGTPSAEGHVRGVRGSVLVSPVGVALDASQFSTVIRIAGSPEVRGVASFHQRGTTHFYGTFDGYVGELQVNSVGRLDGKRLDVKLDVPNAEPHLVRALYPDWPVNQTVAAHAELAGDIPTFRASGHFIVGKSHVDANGEVRLGAEPSVRLAVTGEKVDLRAVIVDSPETSIDTKGEIHVRSTPEGATLEFSGSSEPTTIAGLEVPRADFAGRFAKRLLEARGILHEPGMPVDATFALTTDGVIDIEARAKRFRLESAPRAHGLVPAEGAADIHAKAHIEKGRLDATFDADVDGFAIGVVRVGQGSVHGRASGPVARPGALTLDARANGKNFRAGEFAFDAVGAKVKGPLDRLDLQAELKAANGTAIVAKTKLRAVGGTRLDDVDLSIERDQVSIHAKAARVDLGEGSIEARDVRLEGAGGTLTGSARYRPKLFELEAHGKDVDLGVVSRVLGLSRGTLGGKIDIDAEVVAASDVRKGDVRLSVRDGSLGPVTGVLLELDTTLDEEGLRGEATTRVAGYGRARASWDIELTGDPLERERWNRAAGRLDVGVESFDLQNLGRILPPEWRIEDVRGVLVAQVSLARAEPDVLPNVSVLVATSGLGVTVAPEKPSDEPLDISGIEAGVSANIDGRTGATDASLRLVDDQGVLVATTGHVELDLGRIVARPADLVEQIRTRELMLAAVVHNRPIEKLPELVRPKGVNGTLSAEANLRGTLATPVFSLKAALGAVTLGDEVQSRPFDACLRAQYDPTAARFGFGSEIYIDDPMLAPCAGRRVAIANAAGDFDLAAARAGRRAFRGDAQLSLEDLPLEFVTPLARAHIRGRATGKAALVQSGGEPQISAKIQVADAMVRDLDLGEGILEVRSNGPDVRADLKLTKPDGSLVGEGRAGLDWEGLVPSLDQSRALSATAAVRNVDAAVLQPVLEDVVSDLTGRLDGSVRLALVPGRTPDGRSTWTGDVSGKASLENGSLQLAGLGMRLSALRFEAEAKKKGGRTIISVRKLSAASRSKNPNVSASADLYLVGLDFEGGRANVNLRDVPLMIQGTPQATLTGTAAVQLERYPDRIHVLVSLPKMVAELPRSSAGGVLPVDSNPDIEILQPVAEPTLRTGGGGLPWILEFQLGQDVVVQRADMRVPIDGGATVALGKEVQVAGDIDIEPGGRVRLLGKAFVIEQGEVHFDTGDPTNPHLRVLASWRAPDATIVYVEVRGTFREATLRLESDPARSEAEIQALLLGGGTTGDSGEAQSAGVGYGADFASELLADTNLPHVELRTGSEAATDDRKYQTYTAAVQISDEVWFEGSYKNLSETDTTEQGDALSGTVDWRFRRNWSLRTELGNIGTGVDLLWQYRY